LFNIRHYARIKVLLPLSPTCRFNCYLLCFNYSHHEDVMLIRLGVIRD